MKRAFLIGYPVGHSLSPTLQNASFATLATAARYELLETPPGELVLAVQRIAEGDAIGANVTVPHKQAIVQYLDGIDESASKVGAVNTIVKRRGRLIGANTDVEGLLRALEDAQVKLAGMQVVVLGAGGAARAAVFAIAGGGAAEITIINRTVERALSLQRSLGLYFPAVRSAVNRLDAIGKANLVVNATSVGMVPDINKTPMPLGHSVQRDAVAFDLVYRPRETHFLRDAKKAGALTIDGLGMLVHQGRASFRMWTGKEAPSARSLYAAVLDSG